MEYLEHKNNKLNSLQKSKQQKELDELKKIEEEKQILKNQIKITSSFKDSNITDSIDTKWRKKRDIHVREMNRDCTFQPSPLRVNKNKLDKPNDNKEGSSEHKEKVKNVHDRL